MPKFKLEYIWLDGYEPVPNLRSKTKIEEYEDFPTLDALPVWGFDGSSTRQADGGNSDCMLKPVALYPDPARNNGGARDVRGDAPGRDAASHEQPRVDPGRPGHLVRVRAGVLLLPGRRAARVSRGGRLPGPAGRVLHRRRLPQRR